MRRILLFGAPGSGKGTMGDLLVKDFTYMKISTGDMIREEVKRGSDLGKRVQTIMETGNLVPDEWIIEMVRQRLEGQKGLGGYILDGFPRTLAQAESLCSLPVEDELAIFLHVDEDELVRRLTSRLTCGKCGAIYNILSLKPKKEGVCDACGGALIRRPDDVEETIRQRIAVYHRQTLPVIDYYRTQQRLVSVEGSGTPDAVYQKIKEAVA